MKMKTLSRSLFLLAFLPLASSHAGSANWDLNPPNGDWNTSANWNPATVPNGAADTATFNLSNTAAVSLSANVQVASIVFGSGAPSYTVTVPGDTTLTISGSPAIANNSGVAQNFVLPDGNAAGGLVNFIGSASAGALIHFELSPSRKKSAPGGQVTFHSVSSAGSASFDLNGSSLTQTSGGGVIFYENAFASSGTFAIHGPQNASGNPADLLFLGSSSAASGTFICAGSAFANKTGGAILFQETSRAAFSTITANGGSIANSLQSFIYFSGSAAAESATLIANGGKGLGGQITFAGNATGGTARVMLFGNGQLDISQETLASVTIGSLEGQGPALLGSRNLSVGSASTDTAYAGVIQDGGFAGGTGAALTKVGTGTLTLTGASTYTGGTTISSGNLVISNRHGSGAGTGAVQVNGGALGGRGLVAGPVTVGSGSGGSATLRPALGGSQQMTFTMQSALTCNSNATYSYTVSTSRGTFDQVVANGVAINGAARFVFRDLHGIVLPSGTVFTAISNTAATPIVGTFSNLTNGSTLVGGSNSYLVSYEGGDGNDLTLMVQ